MIEMKASYIGALIAFLIIFSSIIGIVFLFGNVSSNQGSSSLSSDQEMTIEEQKSRIAAAFQAFLNTVPQQDNTSSYELYMAMHSAKPVIILFWPSSCASCISYKETIWDEIKTKFDNVTFLDYNIDTPEGAYLAYNFEITGITIVFAYNGTIYGISVGEHIPYNYLEYMVKAMSLHAGGEGK